MKRGRRAQFDRVAAEAWGTEGVEPCAVCGGGPVEAHHLLYAAWLRSVAATKRLDYERLRWDVRNRLWTCRDCHERHHNASRRIPMGVLHAHAPEVFDFAYELGLDWRLDKTYPVDLEEAA